MCRSHHTVREYACLAEALTGITPHTESLPSLEGLLRRECSPPLALALP